jgi:hypothetical protein
MEDTTASCFKVGNIIEVIETFTSEDKALPKGTMQGAKLLRGQRGKVQVIDNEGAYISFPDHGRTVFVCKSHLDFKLALATVRSEKTAASPGDLKAFDSLVEKQNSRLAGILSELQTQKRKTSCWAWWVFPTEKEGMCDPVATRVTRATATMLVRNPSTVHKWQQVLETICDLVEGKGITILPRIDHGRVHWFIKFWLHLEASPDWMKAVCNRLDRFNWPPS